MTEMLKGNLLWKDNTAPIDEENPLHTKDVNSDDVLTKLEQVRTLLSGVATDAKLEQARALLATIGAKDFATEATLAAVLGKLQALELEMQAVKTAMTDGSQKVQQSDAMERFGASVNDRPAVESVAIGTTFTLLDGSFDTWINNGVNWEEM